MKKTKKIKKPKQDNRQHRKVDVFRKANAALLFISQSERECVIKAVAIVFGISL